MSGEPGRVVSFTTAAESPPPPRRPRRTERKIVVDELTRMLDLHLDWAHGLRSRWPAYLRERPKDEHGTVKYHDEKARAYRYALKELGEL